ncbi:endonuclease V [Microbulbifer variabilis]|uniref:endonuclease V n=1 Tax=Microbulbifer variabilis TaxID=266805 RepID=UPI000380B07A|nr:endonuclease V [Microbulbifer variabilis]
MQYADNTALAAGVIFPRWDSDEIERILLRDIGEIVPYESGNFYKRELPCILALLEDIEEELEAIVIDGFVSLGSIEKAGLGMHLYNAIDKSVPILGVAKKSFVDTPKECEIYRGCSAKPLFVTSAGINLEEAKSLITSMHGKHRIPTILKKADQLCRGINA